jgi:N-acetylglucosaminyl-diphospho-decaprenol L-rhamnosyltransferase
MREAASASAVEPLVTVTTVLYNSEASLARYAAAVAPSMETGLVRVVVVDNASPDGSVALLRRLLPAAEIVGNSDNLGFAGGCNRAWPSVRSRYWMLVNPDVEADACGVERLVRWMDAHPKVGLASPRLRRRDGTELPIARPNDRLWQPLLEALRLHKLLPQSLRSRLLLAGRRATPEVIDGWVPGAALIARTEAVRAVGPLDEGLFMYGEDREWCWRMREAGWQVGVCSDVAFLHDAGSSASTTWDPRERARREVAGHLGFTTRVHGRRWMRVFALLSGVVLFAESLDPRRGERSARRLRSRLYLRAGLRGGLDR